MRYKELGIFMAVIMVVGGALALGFSSNQITNQAAPQRKSPSRYETPPSQWHSPPNVSIGKGFAIESADYIIFKGSEGNIYAKSGDNGQIMYESDNASKVIQDVLGAGRRILIKGGKYTIDSGINIQGSNVTLGGVGTGTVLATPEGENTSCLISIDGAENVTVASMLLDGGRNTDNGPENAISVVSGTSHFTLKSLAIRGARSHDIGASDTEGGTVKNVTCHLSGGDAIAMDGVQEVTVANCTVKDGQSDGIDFPNSNRSVVRSCFVENCSGKGIGAPKVVNNRVDNVGGNGIIGKLVKGNTVKGAEANGIKVWSSTVVSGNWLEDENQAGIYVESENNVIRGNYIENCGNSDTELGIIIANSSKNLVANNHIERCYGYAIEINGSSNQVLNNYLLNNSTDLYDPGIKVDGGSNVVTRNKVVTTATHQKGISITGGTNNVVRNNDLRGAWSAAFPEIANTNNVIERNPGFVTENSGVVADAVPIDSAGANTVTVSFPNAFDNAPEVVNATLTNFDNDSAVAYVVQTTNIDTSSFDLKVYVDTASATTGDNADVAWHAEDKTYG